MSVRSRVFAPLACAVAMGLLGLVAAPVSGAPAPVAEPRKAPSQTVFARSSYLCMGYAACRAAGMGNAGYAQASDKMYWRMYAGHNCTNYAAYRMVRSGLPDERPWSGGGNATYWGTSMPKITDDVPRVGSVAWWKANTGPAGSAGHVAYVERVVSPDEIVISQDSWGGDFSWAVVTRGSGNWPSGFIHFNDVPMVNKTRPVVDGIAKVGSVLSTTPGRWRPADASVAYQWFADGQPIRGAREATFQLTKARLGQQITVTTTATKLGYPTVSAASAPTDAVLPGVLKNTERPAITGVAQVDQILTLSPGTWTPQADLHWQWLADGKPVPGTTDSRELVLAPDLVGRAISATVTASQRGYDEVSVVSEPTARVAPGFFTITTQPSINGRAKLGRTLTVDPGVFHPHDAAVEVQWLRDGEPVATGDSYRVSEYDLGSSVSVQVTLSRAGYISTTAETRRTPVVKSDPTMRIRTQRGVHRVRVMVTVRAPGVSEVTGQVLVRVAGVTKEVDLRGGTAAVTLKGLRSGERTMTIRYGGSDTVTRVVEKRTVRIR